VAAIYRQRHPERTVLYRVLATHFESFITRYDSLFQRRYGYLRPVDRQVVFTTPKIIRPFFRYRRALLSDLCMCAVRALSHYMRACVGIDLMPGVVAVI
jgi:hypothetical protein